MTDVVRKVMGQAWNVFSGSISFIIGTISFLIVLVYIVFLLIDFQRIAKGWSELVPQQYRSQVTEIFQDLQEGMHIYFRAQGQHR